jgi:hypothetical protein
MSTKKQLIWPHVNKGILVGRVRHTERIHIFPRAFRQSTDSFSLSLLQNRADARVTLLAHIDFYACHAQKRTMQSRFDILLGLYGA